MGYKVGVDKKQLTLLPVSLDEYIPEDHICRVISAFTEQLDIVTLGYQYAECKDTGCRPYDPRLMIQLYMYGYLHRIRSSRRLRDETRRNVEVMWLMEGLTPDDKTISNFRKDNTKALRETFREYVKVCRRLGLYGEEITAEDGVKVRANNSLKHNYNETVVKNELGRIEKKITEYMKALEEGDKEEGAGYESNGAVIKAALEALKEKKEKYEGIKERVEKDGDYSTVDQEARLMRTNGEGRKVDVGYNVQTVVDSKYHMVVDFEVTNQSGDVGNLYTMTGRAKEVLEVEELTVLADKGYYDSEDIAACEGNGVTCLVAKRKPGGEVKGKAFMHDAFVYDAQEDTYRCPCGEVMRHRRTGKKKGAKEYKVYVNYEACRKCLRKSECTKYKYREVRRMVCQDIVDKVDERTRKHKGLYRQRQEIIEHVFGTVKAVWGYRQYLCRGKAKVTAETALAYLAYNMRRTVNIFKESKLIPVFV
jgi:transposase/IS5 family transposase